MQNGRTENKLNTENTLNRVWKVVYKDPENGLPVHTQYVETDFRVDALRLANDKIPTNKFIVTATTSFNRNELLTKREQEEMEKNALTEEEKDTIEKGVRNSLNELKREGVGLSLDDVAAMPHDGRSLKEIYETDDKDTAPAETGPMTGAEYSKAMGWPMPNPFTEQAEKVDKMLEAVREDAILEMNYPADHQVIKDLIVGYFLKEFFPMLSILQVLEIFQDTDITFGDLKDFLEKWEGKGL